jgi:hypothetical protein
MPRSNKTNKPVYNDVAGIRKTLEAPRVQDGPSYEDKLPVSESAMSLDEFMARNPSAKSKDRVKTAQKKQGKRRGPKTHPTARSKRGGGSVPARGRRTWLAKAVEDAMSNQKEQGLVPED